MRKTMKFTGWQLILSHHVRRSRRTWRARWPVMVGGTYRRSADERQLNGGYVRVGDHMFFLYVMPWHPAVLS